MSVQNILSHCDHTELHQCASFNDIKCLIDDAVFYRTASVCIPPCYVKEAAEYSAGKIKICTVVGFPNGYNLTAVKAYETQQALNDGADEIDMVINIGELKAGNFDYVKNEIVTLKELCGKKILKVIVEACLLTQTEKEEVCRIVTEAGADYIKTSTGFSMSGASFDDVRLFSQHIGANIKIKAAGGIRSFDDAEKYIALGADRIGESALVNSLK